MRRASGRHHRSRCELSRWDPVRTRPALAALNARPDAVRYLNDGIPYTPARVRRAVRALRRALGRARLRTLGRDAACDRRGHRVRRRRTPAVVPGQGPRGRGRLCASVHPRVRGAAPGYATEGGRAALSARAASPPSHLAASRSSTRKSVDRSSPSDRLGTHARVSRAAAPAAPRARAASEHPRDRAHGRSRHVRPHASARAPRRRAARRCAAPPPPCPRPVPAAPPAPLSGASTALRAALLRASLARSRLPRPVPALRVPRAAAPAPAPRARRAPPRCPRRPPAPPRAARARPRRVPPAARARPPCPAAGPPALPAPPARSGRVPTPPALGRRVKALEPRCAAAARESVKRVSAARPDRSDLPVLIAGGRGVQVLRAGR